MGIGLVGAYRLRRALGSVVEGPDLSWTAWVRLLYGWAKVNTATYWNGTNKCADEDYLAHFPTEGRGAILLRALASVYGKGDGGADTAVWLA